ncbi:flagellar basal body-associated FliL family protein [Marinobacterium jannaschii]|uniref:flagellar basal body-associated FliL family protein n=1 Tax=Marinobacterium jannaschii TaxID=64970 RepID=UPI000485A668|nr:flagellar basal body-associated FliL family protein [Marinobacterium jannaschii]
MADEQDNAAEESGGKKKSKLKLIIILVVALLVVGGGGAGAAYFLLGDSSEEVAETEEAEAEQSTERQQAIYTKVRTMEGRPMFVVTLQSADGRSHYMQAYVEAKSRDQVVADALKLHMPVVVSRLNAFFSTQTFETLQTQSGKVALRQHATDLVREVMMERIGKPGVETVLFTNFVMQ